MFERYTEKARRVIFFARYEASNYGSPYIETEHLLLGLLKEDHTLAGSLMDPGNAETELRAEIEKRITRGKRISTSVEVPLTNESKRILNFAGEESERLGQRYVGTEHILLGILREQGSLAAQLLRARGLEPQAIRQRLPKIPPGRRVEVQPYRRGALLALDSFLVGLKGHNSEELVHFFAQDAQFVDAFGKRWNREEIYKGFATLFAPYAKKNAEYVVEQTLTETADLLVTTVLWKNAILASEQRAWIHRLSFVLVPETEDWAILLVQATPVQTP